LWQEYFSNPLEWWDNRTNKVNYSVTTCLCQKYVKLLVGQFFCHFSVRNI